MLMPTHERFSKRSSMTRNATAANVAFYMTGDDGQYQRLVFQTVNDARWAIESDSGAEGSGDTGSDFGILRYDNAGSYIDEPFNINRATGEITVGAPIGGSNTGALNVRASASNEIGALVQASTAASDRAVYLGHRNYTSSDPMIEGLVGDQNFWLGRGSTTVFARLHFNVNANASGDVIDFDVGGTTALAIDDAGAVILGADPGGSDVLRVAGDCTIAGDWMTFGTTGSSWTYMVVTGDATTYRAVRCQTGGALRWIFGANGAAESGSDVGSNFVLDAFTDAGGSIGTAFSVTRASLKSWFFGDVELQSAGTMLTFGSGGPTLTQTTGSGTNQIEYDDGSTNPAILAGVVVSTSAASGDYPEGTIWIQVAP